jgi:hypothetical protein
MALFDLTALITGLKEQREDYQEIFGIRLEDGFGAGKDFIKLPVKEKYTLVRVILSALTQPGLTGAVNNAADFMVFKNRTGELQPGKVDLLLNEDTIQKKLNLSFLANRQPNDPKDIHSFAGQQFIMKQLYNQIGSEVNNAVYKGELGYIVSGVNETAFQGGLNLFDGFGFKFLKGFATSGGGAIGDIPAANKQVSPAASMTESVILAELKKFFKTINSLQHIQTEMANDAYSAINYSIFLPYEWKIMLDDALDALPYKTDNVVKWDEAKGAYVPKALPRTTLKFRSWMNGTGNMWFSPDDNLFWLTEENANEGDTAEAVCKLKIQEKDRGVQFLIDWRNAVDYADGRFIVLWK